MKAIAKIGRLRFRLRTLFVMVALAALVCGWIAHCRNWITHRHTYLAAYGAGSSSIRPIVTRTSRPPKFTTVAGDTQKYYSAVGVTRVRADRIPTIFAGAMRRTEGKLRYTRFVLWAHGEPERATVNLEIPIADSGHDLIETAHQLFPEADIHWSVFQ